MTWFHNRVLGAASLSLISAMTAAAGAAAPASGQTPAAEAGAEDGEREADRAFEDIYRAEWAWRQDEDGETEDAVPDSLPSVSKAKQDERLAYWDDVLDRLSSIDPEALSPENAVHYAVYLDQIRNLAEAQRFREYEIPLNSAGGFWSGLSYAVRDSYDTAGDYERYLAWLSDIPRYFEEQEENMKAGAARGFTWGRVALEGREVSIAGVADAASAEEVFFYEPFTRMPDTIPDETRRALRERARTVIADTVIPAYQDLLDFFTEDYLPQARETIAAYDLPGGQDYYDWKVRQYTTLDQTPDEVHEIGLREVAKIRAQMMDVIEEVGFEGDLPAFLTFLRTDPQFYAETPEEYLKEAAWDAKVFDGKAARYFGRLPRTRFDIRPFPPEIAPYTTGAAGGRTTYWLNTYDLGSRPLYSLAALTLHESAPGHSFQASIAAENDDQPDFRRLVYISAYGEGWALYCEKLGVEMGMYETPYDVFGMLSYQMWRAARLVVDTGLHAKGWSRERAVRYLLENTAIGEHEIGTEVDRYITNPGQAVSYYTGQLAIEEARANAEAALGADFDIRNFHDTILALGSVPLPVLEERIDHFIADGGPSPYADR